jgi:hypothetical protein
VAKETGDNEMTDVKATEDKEAVIASTESVIDQLRQRIDHLKVQVDLGKLDARDEAGRQLSIAQNACLAAEVKLRDARHDLAVTAGALRDGVERLVRDVKKAIDAAQAAISRG